MDQVRELAEKWFGTIPSGQQYSRNLPEEPAQNQERCTELRADVPFNAIYKVYHMPDRLDHGYNVADLFSDLFGHGDASRLHISLVKEQKLMTKVGSYITGSVDPGLFVISGKLRDGVTFAEVETAIQLEIDKVQLDDRLRYEIEKVKVQAESSHLFSEMEVLNRAMALAYFTMLGDTELINSELQRILSVTAEDVIDLTKKMLSKTNCSTLYYHKV